MDFRILGPLEVMGNGRACRLVGTRLPALLAMLLLHANRTVSSDHAVRGVWGEPPTAAKSNLRTYVARLRGALTAVGGSRSLLTTQPGGYRLNINPDDLDLMRFQYLTEAAERAAREADSAAAFDYLRQALDLWRGEPLAGLKLSPLLLAEAARLEQRRLFVIQRWADAALATGHHEEAAIELTRLVDMQPLREQASGQLMLALYRSNRQGEALAVYRQAYQLLGQELGLAPSRSLQLLHQQILTRDPRLDPPTRSVTAT